MGRIVIFVALISIVSTGCWQRSMYTSGKLQREYNVEEATAALIDLHQGTLVVSVPTDHKKISLLQAVYDKDPSKKRTGKELESAMTTIDKTRRDFERYFPLYTFSEYILVDDTLVKPFLAGYPVSTMTSVEGMETSTVSIDTTKKTFVCRAGRVHDDISIRRQDGSAIAAPFPLGSQLSLGDIDMVDNDALSSILEESVIGHAIVILDAKLNTRYANLVPAD